MDDDNMGKKILTPYPIWYGIAFFFVYKISAFLYESLA